MLRRWPSRFVLLFAFFLFLPAAAAGAARGQAPPSLDWSNCGGGFECATLSVPLNYEDPGGRQISIALNRLKARDSSNRIGVLLANPGGPGASGLDFMRRWGPTLSGRIRDRFDLIGFDPRGVGQSTPLVCHDDLLDLVKLPPNPETDQEWDQIVAETRKFADLCAQRGADLLPYLGTESAARDMDEIRKALGEDKISYLGYSYGTILGAVYADLFPHNLRAAVLDGAADIAVSGADFGRQQALGFEGELQHFFAYCHERQCLGSVEPADAMRQLIARAEASPIPAPQADRPLSAGEAVYGILGSLYSDALWPELTSALNAALGGNGSMLLRITDRYLGRRADGSFDNSTEMNAAVNCLDKQYVRDPAYHLALAREMETRAPFFGGFVASGGLVCALWPAKPEPLTTPRAAGAPPILVIGTTGDPATPYVWAEAVARELESGVLLTYDGEGHTAYRRGDSCIDNAVNDYLLTVQPPPGGTSCGNPALAQPLDVQVGPATATPGPTATGAPEATASPEPTAAPAANGGDGGLSPAETTLIVLLALAVVLVIVVVWLRRRA